MELRHLHVVLTVAEAGSISRAASSLKIAQAGLTAQLRRIERGFGGPLFLRRTDGVELTELGRHVVLRSRDLVERFDDLLVTARGLAAESGGLGLRLGGVAGSPTPLLVSVVRDLLPNRPQTTHIERSRDAVLELVRAGKLDVALVAEFPQSPLRIPEEVDRRCVVVEPMLVGVATSHRLAQRKEIPLSELADEDWAVPEESYGGGRVNLRLACEAAGFTPRCVHFGVDPLTAAELVRAGHTVACFFPSARELPGVALKPIVGNPVQRRVTLVWRRGCAAAEYIEDIRAALLRAYLEQTWSLAVLDWPDSVGRLGRLEVGGTRGDFRRSKSVIVGSRAVNHRRGLAGTSGSGRERSEGSEGSGAKSSEESGAKGVKGAERRAVKGSGAKGVKGAERRG
ncbi:LysR family transcriptional regulator [Saccharothrix australiensis]|uniref:DNA-binding transcriptional LysR family regulator n=1 Tax=Saccharothrix australiensis TaxID=2072 RepID=A0A495W6M0_9PSEU|nr:LysR family transcriptional regulator [Saccharothrix australiensis]RKT56465.1 DNA-binding transcriptional LysR family regulator [Saccharothrix australiensis]